MEFQDKTPYIETKTKEKYMTAFFSTSTGTIVRSLAIVAAFGLLFASCGDKHLCDAYSQKTIKKNAEKAQSVAYADPSVRANG